MNTSVKLLFGSLNFGEPVIVENLISIPIQGERFTSLDFLTLNEALDAKVIQILEKVTEGSVPELLVKNLGETPVLMLDGEEVKGAKQNRVINTTILIKEKSTTVIPVSCTEQGRWSYESECMEFASSDIIMNSASRHRKMDSVNANLRKSNVAVSDQCDVWDSVRELHRKSGTHSYTEAMNDAFSAKSKDIDEYLDAIKLVEDQIGCFIFLNDRILGFDILPCNDSYSKYHNKLIKSYIMDAISNSDKKVPSKNHSEKARAFIESLINSNESSHSSVGYGLDYRYDTTDAVGSSLVVDEVVVHSAFFALDKKNDPDMHSSLKRRIFRMD